MIIVKYGYFMQGVSKKATNSKYSYFKILDSCKDCKVTVTLSDIFLHSYRGKY